MEPLQTQAFPPERITNLMTSIKSSLGADRVATDYDLAFLESRRNAVGAGNGQHWVLSARDQEATPREPTCLETAALIAAIQLAVRADNGPGVRLELNTPNLRHRPHFHIHAICTSDTQKLLTGPYGSNSGMTPTYTSPSLGENPSVGQIYNELNKIKEQLGEVGYRTIIEVTPNGTKIMAVRAGELGDRRSVDPW